MTDNTENLVLEILRRMQGDLTAIRADVADLKVRMSAMEQHFAILLGSLSAYTDRVDRVEKRVERIERRLELRDEA